MKIERQSTLLKKLFILMEILFIFVDLFRPHLCSENNNMYLSQDHGFNKRSLKST
jgi:hypothetical protein